MQFKDRTNHHLFYAETLIKKLEEPNNDLDSVSVNALCVSVCLNLQACWQAWVGELSQLTKQTFTVDSLTLDALKNGALEHIPEISYLSLMARDQISWVNDVCSIAEDPLAWYNVHNTEIGQKAHVPTSLQTITLVDLGDGEGDSIICRLSRVTRDLKAFVGSTREQQTEW